MIYDKKIIIITTIVLIITIGGTIWFYTNNSNIEYSNKVDGLVAPNFELSDYKKFYDMLENKETILLFWSPRCSHCKNVIEYIQNHEKYNKLKDYIFTVAVNSEIEEIKEFSNIFNIYVDYSASIFKEFNGEYIPTSFIITKSGKIISRGVGEKETMNLLNEFIEKNIK